MVSIVERRRPTAAILALSFGLLFALLGSLNYASAFFQSKVSSPVTIQDNHPVWIVRGGSLDEGAEDTDSDDDSSSLTEMATALRLEGKRHHDEGDFVKAAEVFREAADTLLNGDDEDSMRLSEDYATCRLHQALCNLKSENYELCIEACTDVLQDDSESAGAGSNNHQPAINARAYHRRAKAKMALGDNAGALQDARTASFLGDNKAVNLYGKLMRESSASDFSSLMNPTMPTPSDGGESAFSPQSALLDSLMSKSSSPMDAGSGGFPGLNSASLLMGSGGGSNMLGALGSGGSGMAKSLVTNLVKKLDDESTHTTICNFLQNTDKAQLSNLLGMAGASGAVDDKMLDKIVNFCHGVTPKGIRRTVKGTKVVVYFYKVIQRTLKLVNKYKSILVALLILQWTKSAILRPLPVNKRAIKKAARLAAKEALKEASKAGFF